MGNCFGAKISSDSTSSSSSPSGTASKYTSRNGAALSNSSSYASVASVPRSEGEILESANVKAFTFNELRTATRSAARRLRSPSRFCNPQRVTDLPAGLHPVIQFVSCADAPPPDTTPTPAGRHVVRHGESWSGYPARRFVAHCSASARLQFPFHAPADDNPHRQVTAAARTVCEH